MYINKQVFFVVEVVFNEIKMSFDCNFLIKSLRFSLYIFVNINYKQIMKAKI
jgi:hypothetical protein